MAERDPRAIELYNQGVAHARAGRSEEARAAYEQALALAPDYAQALNNLGTILDDAGEHNDAESRYRAALAADGARPEPWVSLGTNLRMQGRYAEARDAYRKALALRPDFAAARWNLALIDLADGHFTEGWTNYLFRPSIDRTAVPLASPPLAADLSGVSITIVDEQGLGDALFFLRFVPELRRRGARVSYAGDHRLAGIVGRMADVELSAARAGALTVALGDLPYLLGAGHYPPPLAVRPLPERIAKVRTLLAAAGPRPYFGLTWRAGQDVPGYLTKSIGVAALGAAMRDLPGTLIDVQRAPLAGEHAALEQAAGRPVLDLGGLNDDLEDMLAAMALLDEYVGVSSTNMHLRASAGVAARVLVAHPPDYRWMATGDSSPWFPAFRLYRAKPEAGWAAALAALRAELFNDRAVLAHRAGRLDEAANSFRHALIACPDVPQLHFNFANLLRDRGESEAAADYYRRVTALQPAHAAAHNNLGNLHKLAKRWDAASAAYRDAIAADPGFAPAHRNLADLDETSGRIEAAVAGWQRVRALRDDPGAAIRDAISLPVIASSVAEIDEYRARMASRLAELADRPLRLENPLGEVGATSFHLAYHGRNDRALMQTLADVYRKACPSLVESAPHVEGWLGPLEGGRLRIGFLSSFLGEHTIGRLTGNLIAGLDRDRFEIRVFDRLPRNLDLARQMVAEAELDILYYPDIGMEPLTYFLSFARLAPIQCVSWGHPVTTGVPSLDYFISSRLLEPAGAADHYSENLVQLDYMPSSVSAPETGAAGGGGPVFVCPQSLFKLHPDFDPIIGAILAKCPGAELHLLEGQHAEWQRLLEARWRRTIPEVMDRIRFAPRRDRAGFMALLASAKVVLDTPHFCGGISSFEALVAGTPVVALPGAFMRARVTLGLYRRMEMTDLVAADAEEYVALAVRLARDDAFRWETCGRIRDSVHRLIDDPAPVAEHAAFFEKAIFRES